MKTKIHIHRTIDGYWVLSNPDGTQTAICTGSRDPMDLFRTRKKAEYWVRQAGCTPIRDFTHDAPRRS